MGRRTPSSDSLKVFNEIQLSVESVICRSSELRAKYSGRGRHELNAELLNLVKITFFNSSRKLILWYFELGSSDNKKVIQVADDLENKYYYGR
jgi:hypothetical protein